MTARPLLALAAAASVLTATAPAMAHPGRGHARGHAHAPGQQMRYMQTEQGRVGYWRGDDGRYHCRRANGTTGLIVGAAGGALVGRAIDGGRDRTVGTILGAAGGALLGREVDRSISCR